MMEKNAQLGMSSVIPGYSADGAGMPQQDISYAKDEEVMFELGSDEPEEDIVFILSPVPGALDDSDIIVDEPEAELEVEEPKEDVVVEEADPWDWSAGGLEKFIPWLHDKMHNIPTHSGKDASGLERTISIFETLLKETSNAMKKDIHGKISSDVIEKARDELYRGLDRLYDRLDKVHKTKSPKKKKKADDESGLVKEAGSPKIQGITISVPLFISAIVRAMINGYVSAGHDMKSTYDHFDKKYKFSDKDKLEVITLLSDSGYPLPNFDRGLVDEEIDGQDESRNFDNPVTYPG